jgi:hypothetical protein
MFLESLVCMWLVFGYIFYLQNLTEQETVYSEISSEASVEEQQML